MPYKDKGNEKETRARRYQGHKDEINETRRGTRNEYMIEYNEKGIKTELTHIEMLNTSAAAGHIREDTTRHICN